MKNNSQCLDPHSQVVSVLMDIECSMRKLNLWSDLRPSDDLLSSQQPFAVDTLSFDQWLQFIFIERLNVMVEEKLDLPEKCEIAPMAEEYFRQISPYPAELIELIKQIDRIITES